MSENKTIFQVTPRFRTIILLVLTQTPLHSVEKLNKNKYSASVILTSFQTQNKNIPGIQTLPDLTESQNKNLYPPR